MAKILISPSKYIQGAGEMKKLGTYADSYGKKALVLISKGGHKRIGAEIEESFAESGMFYRIRFLQRRMQQERDQPSGGTDERKRLRSGDRYRRRKDF